MTPAEEEIKSPSFDLDLLKRLRSTLEKADEFTERRDEIVEAWADITESVEELRGCTTTDKLARGEELVKIITKSLSDLLEDLTGLKTPIHSSSGGKGRKKGQPLSRDVVMEYFRENPAPAKPAEIQQATSLKKPTLAVALKALLDSGNLKREKARYRWS